MTQICRRSGHRLRAAGRCERAAAAAAAAEKPSCGEGPKAQEEHGDEGDHQHHQVLRALSLGLLLEALHPYTRATSVRYSHQAQPIEHCLSLLRCCAGDMSTTAHIHAVVGSPPMTMATCLLELRCQLPHLRHRLARSGARPAGEKYSHDSRHVNIDRYAPCATSVITVLGHQASHCTRGSCVPHVLTSRMLLLAPGVTLPRLKARNSALYALLAADKAAASPSAEALAAAHAACRCAVCADASSASLCLSRACRSHASVCQSRSCRSSAAGALHSAATQGLGRPALSITRM